MPKEYILLVVYMVGKDPEVRSHEIAVAAPDLSAAVKRAKDVVFGAHPDMNRDTDFRFVKIYYEMGTWAQRGSMQLYWDEKKGYVE